MMAADNTEDSRSLTEFTPISPVEPSSRRNFFSKFFRRSEDKSDQKSEDSFSVSSTDIQEHPDENNVLSSTESCEKDCTNPPQQERTLASVLKRLSNILDTRGQTPQVYKDSDFKQYWMPDQHCKECYECGDKFNTFRRRHHCRICGQVFCSRCCNQEVPGKIMGYTGFLRVCTYCCKVVLSYAQNPEVRGDLQTFGEDLQRQMMTPVTEHDFSQVKEPYNLTTAIRKGNRASALPTIFDEESQTCVNPLSKPMTTLVSQSPAYTEMCLSTPLPDPLQHERKVLLQDSKQLREIYQTLSCPDDGIELQSHRHRLRTYDCCIIGSEIVDWLINRDHAVSREQAAAIGQALLDGGWMDCISANQQTFMDQYALYRLRQESYEDTECRTEKQIHIQEDTEDDTEPLWFQKIEHNSRPDDTDPDCLSELNKIPSTVSVPDNLDISSRSVFYVQTPPTEPQPKLTPRKVLSTKSLNEIDQCPEEVAENFDMDTSGVWQEKESALDESEDFKAFDQLRNCHAEHLNHLVQQLLTGAALPVKWADTICSLARRITSQVQPDVKHEGDDMDIRQYVLIKKVPGGIRSQSTIISGVVCSKNIAHKHMRNTIVNPKILLLRAPIEYQRVERKFSSLEPQILQEHDFLKNCVARIAELEPDLLLVEKPVSRLAQDFIRESGITLVLNVKPSVMERVARFTQADIVTSIDGLVSKKTLGFCHSVKTQTFQMSQGSQKTLLYFDGCASHLGCTVILRGGTTKELVKVKRILQFFVYVTYHSKLEMSFLMDEFALPLGCVDCSSTIKGRDKKRQSFSQHRICTHSTSTNSNNSNKTDSLMQDDALLLQSLDQSAAPFENYQQSFSEVVTNKTSEPEQAGVLFERVLNQIVLSVSPFVKYEVPYLETEHGSECKLRQFFPQDIFVSDDLQTFHPDFSRKTSAENFDLTAETSRALVIENKKLHQFVCSKLTAPFNDPLTQTLLADFRACGTLAEMVDLSHIDYGISDEPEKCSSPTSWDVKVDCLDPMRHQRIAVLFSSFSCKSANAPNPCVSPWVVTMDYYGRNDITLGGFLERYCFRESYQCPSKHCETSMVDHVRRFVHENGSIHVISKKLESPMPTNQAIMMWNWCCKCRQVSPMVPMSVETWSMSFAKYLELRFHVTAYIKRSSSVCSHNLHHDHFQYFGYKDIVTSFKYFPIDLKEICLPQVTVQIDHHELFIQHWEMQHHALSFKGPLVFSNIMDNLIRLQTDVQEAEIVINEHIKQVKAEKDKFRGSIAELEVLLTEVKQKSSEAHGEVKLDKNRQKGSSELDHLVCKISDSFVRIKKLVAETVNKWNSRILEFEHLQKKTEKEKSRIGHYTSRKDSSFSLLDGATDIATSRSRHELDMETEPTFVVREASPGNLERDQVMTGENTATSLPTNTSHSSNPTDAPATPEYDDVNRKDQPRNLDKSMSFDTRDFSLEFAQPEEKLRKVVTEAAQNPDNRMPNSLNKAKASLSRESSSTDLEKKSVKTLLSNFLSGTGNNPIQMPFPADEHHILNHSVPSCEHLPITIYDQEPSSIIAYALSTSEYEVKLQEICCLKKKDSKESPSSRRRNLFNSGTNESSAESGGQGSKKSGVLSFFRTQGRDKSPNSQGKDVEKSSFDIEAVKYTPAGDQDSLEGSDESDLSTLMSTAETDHFQAVTAAFNTSKTSKQQHNQHHVELQFSDNSANFYCKVYFAEQFRNLRKLVFPSGEERYIRSLSRCFTWLAAGGKSGSSFCKTQDDRFILKEMSRYEVQSFNKIAPHYVNYITESHAQKKPTVLARILGVYRIGFRNSQTISENKQDVLVMENLFYGRNINQIFDLKGSLRNRLVSTVGKGVEVLLDENLLKTSVDCPLYIRPHSKTVLTLAITNDTDFLASHLVMDYSLLVGTDEDNQELVLGIIDYIRTFTWDKKLEMVVKSTYSQLGGQGKMPTVVYPESYRSRFLQAMDRYFLPVPDQWAGLGRDVDC